MFSCSRVILNGDNYKDFEVSPTNCKRKLLKRGKSCFKTKTSNNHLKDEETSRKKAWRKERPTNGHSKCNGDISYERLIEKEAHHWNRLNESCSSARKPKTEDCSSDEKSKTNFISSSSDGKLNPEVSGTDDLDEKPKAERFSLVRNSKARDCSSERKTTNDNFTSDRKQFIKNCSAEQISVSENKFSEQESRANNDLVSQVFGKSKLLEKVEKSLKKNLILKDESTELPGGVLVCSPTAKETLKATENSNGIISLDGENIGDKKQREAGEISPSSNCCCKWINCNEKLESAFDLKIHVKESHVKTMAASDLFFCFWEGCKVYNKPSSSYNWLTKHVNTHVGVRPFQCVIEPCDLSFASQNALVRHVQSHFNERSKYYKKTKNNADKCTVTPMKSKPSTPEEPGSGAESPAKKEARKSRFKMFMRRRTQGPRSKLILILFHQGLNYIVFHLVEYLICKI